MFKVMPVFGIRPDIIRSSLIIKKLASNKDIDLHFVYTGQHYDATLKDVFFKELDIPLPRYNLTATGTTHVEQHAKLIAQLEPLLTEVKPDVVVFLGDANAVIGCIAPLKMRIPIAHIEAGMRSYLWEMPEERNRVIVDRVSDVLYVYHENYKANLIREGIDEGKIVVTGNTIVDVLKEHMPTIVERTPAILASIGLTPKNYAIQTLHRDEHMNKHSVKEILMKCQTWAEANQTTIVLPTMPRIKRFLTSRLIKKLPNYKFIEPVGFFEFIALESCATIEFTDSGTNQETSCLLGTPCVVTRKGTERPETFDSNISVMEEDGIIAAANFIIKKEKVENFSLGDGRASDIIVEDLLNRLRNGFYINPGTNSHVQRHWNTYGNYYCNSNL